MDSEMKGDKIYFGVDQYVIKVTGRKGGEHHTS